MIMGTCMVPFFSVEEAKRKKDKKNIFVSQLSTPWPPLGHWHSGFSSLPFQLLSCLFCSLYLRIELDHPPPVPHESCVMTGSSAHFFSQGFESSYRLRPDRCWKKKSMWLVLIIFTGFEDSPCSYFFIPLSVESSYSLSVVTRPALTQTWLAGSVSVGSVSQFVCPSTNILKMSKHWQLAAHFSFDHWLGGET